MNLNTFDYVKINADYSSNVVNTNVQDPNCFLWNALNIPTSYINESIQNTHHITMGQLDPICPTIVTNHNLQNAALTPRFMVVNGYDHSTDNHTNVQHTNLSTNGIIQYATLMPGPPVNPIPTSGTTIMTVTSEGTDGDFLTPIVRINDGLQSQEQNLIPIPDQQISDENEECNLPVVCNPQTLVKRRQSDVSIKGTSGQVSDGKDSSAKASSVTTQRTTPKTKSTDKSESLFKCPQCSRPFVHEKNLNRHIQYECNKEPRFICVYCAHRSKQASHMREHIRKRHKGMEIKILDGSRMNLNKPTKN